MIRSNAMPALYRPWPASLEERLRPSAIQRRRTASVSRGYPNRYKIPLDGQTVELLVDPLAITHLWGLTDHLVLTVSGDLTGGELLEVAASLEAWEART